MVKAIIRLGRNWRRKNQTTRITRIPPVQTVDFKVSRELIIS